MCLWLIAPGCSSPEEEEHLEHVIPEHKPSTYRETVEQLDRRFRAWMEGSGGAREQQLAEFGDVIRWLPELAADSDLKRQQWEQVRDCAERLSAWHRNLSTSNGDIAREQKEAFLVEWNALDKLVEASDLRAASGNATEPSDRESSPGLVER
jgi:hypothetical protein